MYSAIGFQWCGQRQEQDLATERTGVDSSKGNDCHPIKVASSIFCYSD